MQSEVVGSGLLASAFKKSRSPNCLFFCSGVSNSQEFKRSEFERERKMILQHLESKKTLIYFSSILAGATDNEYYRHKTDMENLVANNSKQHLIFRLPQVAGIVNNGTLLPTFIRKIINNEEIIIYKNAQRCIVDIDHVVDIFDHVYQSGISNTILYCCPDYKFNPIELVELLKNHFVMDARVSYINKDSIQDSILSPSLKRYEYIFGDLNSYLSRIVHKYANKIVELQNKEMN